MHAFYNKEHLGDVLLIQLDPTYEGEPVVEKLGDVAVLRSEQSKEVIGFNLFNASTYVDVKDEGKVALTEEIVEHVQAALTKNNVDYTLEVDLSPKFVVGHVVKKEKHPNADKLSVCQVDLGEGEPVQIVCGAANVDAGQNVVVAKVGAVMPSGMAIRDAQLRGVDSSGMICSASELDLPSDGQKGILVLEEDRQPGEPFELNK